MPASNVQSTIFNDMIIITIEKDDFRFGTTSETAILTLQKSRKTNGELIAHHDEPINLRKGGNLNGKLGGRRMGIVRVEGIPKLIIFGTKAPIEEWNEDLNKWEISTEFQFTSKTEHFAVCYTPM